LNVLCELGRLFYHSSLMLSNDTYLIVPASGWPGFLGQGKSGNFEGVRESQGKQRESGKSQGILKYCSLDQLFMHYIHNFCQLLGQSPQTPTGALPL